MLKKPYGLSIDELVDHVAQDRPNGVEPFVCMANVSETSFVEEDLLDNEDGNSFGEFRTGFHDAETERNYLGRQKEVNNRRVIILLRRVSVRRRREGDRYAPSRGRRLRQAK